MEITLPLSQVTVDLTNPFHGLSHILLGHYLVAIPGKGQFYKWALDYGLQKFAPFIRDDNVYYRLAKLAIVFTAAAALDMAIILAVSDWAMETKQQPPAATVRQGFAGLGGALQGYTFDVLTRQWVTDYEFFVLAHGGTLPGGSGSGAGNGSSNGNSGGSGSGGTGSGK